jgi:hypothetical protein
MPMRRCAALGEGLGAIRGLGRSSKLGMMRDAGHTSSNSSKPIPTNLQIRVVNGTSYVGARFHHNLNQMEATMPVILWLLGVPLVLVIALMLTHVI